MNASDMLRQARATGYGARSGGGEQDSAGSPRSFPLTPEEIEAIGEQSDCIKVYGSHDGKSYSITKVEPDNVQSGDSEIMVKPTTQLSPS